MPKTYFKSDHFIGGGLGVDQEYTLREKLAGQKPRKIELNQGSRLNAD